MNSWNLYCFCLAVARHTDRRTGLNVCKDLVEEHAEALDRLGNEDEFRKAFQRMLEVFAPYDAVRLVSIRCRGRAMARFLVEIVSDGHVVSREAWRNNPILQSYLAAAMRHLVTGLHHTPAPKMRRPAARRAPIRSREETLTELLTDEEARFISWGAIIINPTVLLEVADQIRGLPASSRVKAITGIQDHLCKRDEFDMVTLKDIVRLYTQTSAFKA